MLKTLSSLKLTVLILFSIALLCLVGTVFPQGGAVGTEHGWAARIPPLLSPYDIFRSIWFMAAGLLLCLNLVLCMRGRVKLKLRRRSLLVLLLHGGILLVIAGYAIGSMSLDGLMEIPERGSTSKALLKKGSWHDLGFTVQCDRFTVDYYDNGMPREYTSDLSFLEGGQVAGRARLRVNHPASFSGISFYQESFRQTLAVVMTVADKQRIATIKASEGDDIPLPVPGTRARVVKIWEDLMHTGPAVKLLVADSSGERYLWLFRDIETIRKQVPDLFEKAPHLDPSGFRPYTFSFGKLDAAYVTGIGVKKDPGVLLAGAGGALFLVSLLLLFLAPRSGQGSRGGVEAKGGRA